ncbi:MAG: hypothetical protein LQ338_003573 [Usnochroma carphineum]|nr:MAG: hypothetical protein LQ338_003573 [Usnochroma carphineum]
MTSAPASTIDQEDSHSPSGHDHPQDQENVPLPRFFATVAVAAVSVLLLFLLNIAYLYGTVYHQSNRGAAFHILLVDYDGGVVGRSLLSAYQQLKSPTFPTLFTQSPSQFPSPDGIVHAVRNRQYWGAIFASPGASQRLSAALQGGSAATTYTPREALTYVWDESRYPATADSVIESSFASLVDATRVAYNSLNGTSALAILARNDPAAVRVFLDPIRADAINVGAMPQAAKVFYNTISMAMPILQQFFFVLALNGMSTRFRFYNNLSLKTSGTLRCVVSVAYTLVGALCMTGYIWAFREAWPVHGYQFVETWMVLWLLMHIYFCLVDAATAVLPQPAMPFFIVTWIFLSVSATINPFELTPGFYRWGYALPAYCAYEILTYVWTGGSTPELHRSLPIMFAWWLVGLACAILAHRRRYRLAFSTAGPRRRSVSEKGNDTASEAIASGDPGHEVDEKSKAVHADDVGHKLP